MSARPRPRDPDELLALLPADRPYAAAEVRDAGVTARQIATLVRLGRVRRPVRGVYTGATLPDTLETRLQVLRLVVPAGCVVTDRMSATLQNEADATLENEATGSLVSSLPCLGF